MSYPSWSWLVLLLVGVPVYLVGLPVCLIGLTLYLAGVVAYRLYFHPLAKYPGPVLAKVTDLYQTYHALKGDRHLDFWRCHEKYGPLVRFGPNSLSFNSNTALKEIYGFKSNVRKAPFYRAFWASNDAQSTHSAIDKSVHARKRRVLSHAFSDAAIASMEKHMLAHIRRFCRNLAGATTRSGRVPDAEPHGYGEAVDMSDQANYLAFDIMGDLCFGKAFGMLERPDNRFAIDLLGKAAHRHLICGTCLPIHEWHLDKLLFGAIAAGRARYMQYSQAQAAERAAMGGGGGGDGDRKDFFSYLLAAKDPETGRGFTGPELWGESNLLIIAGSDTTSTALAATVFYLAHSPAALRHATAEARAAFPHAEAIATGPALASLHFLRACLDEAMRLSPSVGGLLPRQVLAGGMRIDGHAVPAGTVVGVPHYALHHNPAYYPDPFAFRPERWTAAAADAAQLALAQSAFCPFSIGPRGCIGKGMAYHELTLTLARMLYLYDLRLAPGTSAGQGRPDWPYGRHRPSEFQLQDSFTSIKTGPCVQFRPRL